MLGKNNNKNDHFGEMVKRLPETPSTYVWTDGREILCQTSETACGVVETLKSMYFKSGIEPSFMVGAYSSKDNGERGWTQSKAGWFRVRNAM